MKKEIKLYNGKISIWFDEEKHIFTDKDGDRILGVTSITNIIDKSPVLIPWAIKMMGNYLVYYAGQPITRELIDEAKREWRKVKEEAADIGSLIHEFAAQWITLKKKPEIPEDEQVRNGAIAFMKWVKDTGVEFDNSEKIIYSKKHNFAGILDADGHINKEHCIIDFKSSSGIYPEMYLQLTGYWLAREEETKIKYNKGYIVQFGKIDGEFHVVEITREEYKKNKEAFLAALTLKKYGK